MSIFQMHQFSLKYIKQILISFIVNNMSINYFIKPLCTEDSQQYGKWTFHSKEVNS